MPHFEAMPLDGMTMPMAMQPNLNNPCLLRQLRMPMQGSQMVSKGDLPAMPDLRTAAPVATPQAPPHHHTWQASEAPPHHHTWEASEENIPPDLRSSLVEDTVPLGLDFLRPELRSSLVEDGSEFMRLLDSLEERVELMSKMQETRRRLQEAQEPAKKEPEDIEEAGLDQPDVQEESGAQLLYDQMRHLSPISEAPISEAPRWCQPDLMQQGAQHPSPADEVAGDEVADGSYAADVRKLLTELERHLEESKRLRQNLQMQREESERLQEELRLERQESKRLRQDLQMQREETERLREELRLERQDRAHEKAIFQTQIKEMQKRLEKMAKSTSSSGSSFGGGESGNSPGTVVRVCTLQMSTDLPKQVSTDLPEGGFSFGKNIAMSEDGLVATRTRGFGQAMVVGSSPIRKTLAGWYYEVRISEVESCGISYCDIGGLAIGVTKQSASPHIRMPWKAWRWPQSTILGYYGDAYLEGSHKKIQWSPDATSLPVGSIVGLLVTNQGDIQVFVDNEEVACLQGVMTLEAETELYPVLDIFNTTRSVELLRPVWSDGSRSESSNGNFM